MDRFSKPALADKRLEVKKLAALAELALERLVAVFAEVYHTATAAQRPSIWIRRAQIGFFNSAVILHQVFPSDASALYTRVIITRA